MTSENSGLGALAMSFQRLNKLLLLVVGIALLLLGMCFWAGDRVLEEERDKVESHFERLVESIHEHEVFLRNAAIAYNQTNQNIAADIRPMSTIELMRHDDELLYQVRGLAMSLPFTLAQRVQYSSAQMQGAFSLGVQLTDYYTAYWSGSYYGAPQLFMFSPTPQFNIAIPGIGSTPRQPRLGMENFFSVSGRLYDSLKARSDALSDNQVRWMRAPQDLFPGRKTIVAYSGVAFPRSVMPSGKDEGLAFLAALLNVQMVNDAGHQLVSSINSRLTLISPVGETLLGADSSYAQLPDGLSFDRYGLRFKLMSAGNEPWVGLYTISYNNFFRYARWSLLTAASVFSVVLLLGWWVNRLYRVRVVEPAQRANRRLTESNAFNRVMLDNAPVGLCVLQRNTGQVLLENQRAQQWPITPQLVSVINRDYSDAPPGEVQIEVDGCYLLVCVVSTRYQDEDVLLCGFNDVTRHVDDANLMEQAKRSADAASEAKTLFLATMSHEIRTPLYGVLGNLELLELTDLKSDQREYLQTIHRSSAALLQLISDVLDVSKIESGQMAVESVVFCPLDIFEDAVRTYAASATNKGLQIYGLVDASLPPLMRGDPGRIRQIINNLLSNAIKFTDSGRVVLRVKVSDQDNGHASLQWQVSDTGVGISHKKIPDLFKPFSQLGEAQSPGGAGLGLSICMRLSQLMSATLRVVSEPGLGSSFSLNIRLPVATGDLAGNREIDLQGITVYVRAPIKEMEQSLVDWLGRWRAWASPLPPSFSGNPGEVLLDMLPGSAGLDDWRGERVIASLAGALEPENDGSGWTVNAYDIRGIARALERACHNPTHSFIPMQAEELPHVGLRVLVAEDNPINRGLLREQLQALGAQVTTAETGEQALQAWAPKLFDLVITDLNMPVMDGYELARALRLRDVDIPIVAVTANAMREEGERCLAVGMNAWLVKPLNLKILRETLARYCPPATAATRQEQPCSMVPGDLDGWIKLSVLMQQLLVDTLQADLDNAQKALDNEDTSGLVSLLHRLNGSFASVRARALSAACNEWEVALSTEALSATSIPAVHSLLERLYSVLLVLRGALIQE
ncbi:response regulator [Pseudomonas sp. ANT_H14]|uniref:hybrid sensor histidine kinase/response regulator n=1 Tax=unclassified Pseudomonas TaxID=196821 RepID=UPI0011EEACBC|nr:MULTISPECIES: hybrid sensor histidine kinase/response regulator [unclassified Pseudomonas]KAA0945712.1 response regulator [Pseudomonas sp. ANT_H4]KAA0951561.1 response regulator [Pseudomonas sp. ANT_H14]